MSKILLATAILGLGIAGALFAVQNTSLPASSASILDSNDNNLIAGGPFVENISDKQGLLNSNGISITDEFAKNLAQKIAEANPTGPKTSDGKKDIVVPNPDKIALDLIIEAQKNFDLKKIIPEIKSSDLKISLDTSDKNLSLYVADYARIIKDSKEKMSQLLKGDFTEEILSSVITTYEKTISSLYELTVPKLFLDFHKTEISYLSAELTLLKKIQDVNQDQIGALLASQNLPSLDKEFEYQINIQTLKIIKPDFKIPTE